MRYRDIVSEVVYHGTPHAFSKFSNEKIGSGEGAQAYGWGLYFAGNKDVAEWYRRALIAKHALNLKSHRMIGDNGSRLEQEIIQKVNRTWLRALRDKNLDGPWIRDIYGFYNIANDIVPELDKAYYEKHKDAIEEKIASCEKRYQDDPEYRARYHEYMGANAKPDWSHFRKPYASAYHAASNELERELTARGHGGNLYAAEIPSDDQFLLWDRPLADQPAPVKQAIFQMGHHEQEESGGDFYHAVAAQVGSPKDASLLLASRGIAGVRYLDGSSRGRGEGHYNYVVFDDNQVAMQA